MSEVIPNLGSNDVNQAQSNELSASDNDEQVDVNQAVVKDTEDPDTVTKQDSEQPDPYGDLLRDDFVKGFLDSYISGDDNVEKLLEQELDRVRGAKIDFESMSDEDVIRFSLKKEYPDLSQSALNKVVDKYFAQFGDLSNLDEDDEDYASEKQIRDVKIRRDAEKYRKALIEEQSKQKRRNIEDIRNEAISKQKQMQEKQMEELDKWEKMVTGHDFVSKVIDSGEMKVGKAESELGFKVKDMDKFKKALTNDPDFFNLFSTGDEKNPVDFKKWAKVVAYALDPDGFESLLLVSGKNAGTEKLLNELENPVKPNTPQVSSPSSLAESLLGAISKRR